MSRAVRVAACGLAAALLAGCAARRPQTLADRFVHKGGRHAAPAAYGANLTPGLSPQQKDAFAAEMAKAKALAAAASRKAPEGTAAVLEQQIPELSAARAALASAPTALNHQRVAQMYAKLGVLDAAYNHFTAAVGLDRKDASAYDGRARVWRDWGFPAMGLADAHHAIFYAPTSPAPQNTLGTLLLKLGLYADARAAFERALALAPDAPYVRANLCHLSLLQSSQDVPAEGCPTSP